MVIPSRQLVFSLLGICLMGGVAFGGYELSQSPYFEIKHLRVVGEDSKRGIEEIQTAVEQVVRENLIFQELEPIRESVNRISWVKESSVTRVWPNELVVRVAHRKPIARWEDDRFVSEEGIVFSPLEDVVPGFEAMPVISGEQRHAREAIDHLRSFEASAQKNKCRIRKLGVSFRQSWKVDLVMANGAGLEIVLGRGEGKASLKERFDRVVSYYRKVCRELERCPIAVDARYRNAFAARWDVGPEPLDRQEEGDR